MRVGCRCAGEHIRVGCGCWGCIAKNHHSGALGGAKPHSGDHGEEIGAKGKLDDAKMVI